MEETLENTCFISLHRNQVNPLLHPKSTLTFAYGDGKYHKFARQMSGDDSVLRTKILREVNEDFHQGDKVNIALETDLLSELVKCFSEDDKIIRELASRAVCKVACTERGREILVDEEIVPQIKNLMDDKEVEIRSNAVNALINIAEFTFGVDSIIDFNIIPFLVDKLIEEKDEDILVLILKLLKILNEGEQAPIVIQNTEAIFRLNKHLESKNDQIREYAALNLGSISYNVIGKSLTIDAKSIPPLTEMLIDKVSKVRAACTRALVSMAQQKEGKVQIYDLDKLNEIIRLLYDDDDQTRLNTVQLICAVGEYPPAKEKFKECLDKLQEMVKKEEEVNPLVSRFAQKAIDIITWLP